VAVVYPPRQWGVIVYRKGKGEEERRGVEFITPPPPSETRREIRIDPNMEVLASSLAIDCIGGNIARRPV